MPKELDLEVHTGNFVRALEKFESFLENQYVKLPARLHHFAPSFDALRSILESKQMWASHAYDMNDKRELRYGSSLVHSCLVEKKKIYAPRKIFQLDEFFEMALERTNPYSNIYNGLPEPFIISLCEDGTSSSQWAKYGNEGNGYCINFDTNKSMAGELRRKNLFLLKVIYDVDVQVPLINAAIQNEIDHILAHLDDPLAAVMGMSASVAFYQLILLYTIAFKAKSWSEEQEWRLVRGMNQFSEAISPETRNRDNEIIRFTRVEFDDFSPSVWVADISSGEKVIPAQSEQVKLLLQKFQS